MSRGGSTDHARSQALARARAQMGLTPVDTALPSALDVPDRSPDVPATSPATCSPSTAGAESTGAVVRLWARLPKPGYKLEKPPSPAAVAGHDASSGGGEPNQNHATGAAWELEDESWWGRRHGMWGRTVLWAAVALLLLLGVKQLVYGTPEVKTPPPAAVRLPASVTFPSAAGVSVAEGFTRAYLSWDAAAPGRRATELAPFLPPATDPAAGWNGQGVQRVDSATVVALSATDAAAATATVAAVVTPGALSGQNNAPPVVEFLVVALRASGPRVGVVAAPVLIGASHADAAPPSVEASLDSSATAASSQFGSQFFGAYGGGAASTLSALLAPGVSLAPLPGVRLASVTGWAVYTAPSVGTTRRATARVSWALPDGAQLTQTYALTLVSISSSGSVKWFVAAVTAA